MRETKPILLIRSHGNEIDQHFLSNYNIPSEIDPYMVIRTIEDREPALRLMGSIKDALDPLLLITSLNAINSFVRIIGEDDFRSSFVGKERVRFVAIGPSTEARLKDLGVATVSVPEKTNSAGIIELLSHEIPGTLIHPVGNLATEDIENSLRPLGWRIHREVLYTNEVVPHPPRSVKGIQSAQYGAILFRSASAVKAFFQWNPTSMPLGDTLIYFAVGKGALKELELLNAASIEVCSPSPSGVAEEISNFLKERDGEEK